MTHHTIHLSLSRQLQQQQKPAPGSSKASSREAKAQSGAMEIPKGYVVRQGHSITAKPVRAVGPKDSEIIQLAVRSFGYLLPMRAVNTLAGFASLIELSCRDAKARAVADTLHRLSA